MSARRFAAVALATALLVCSPAFAAGPTDVQSQIATLQRELAAQKALIQQQELQIQGQQQKIDHLNLLVGQELATMRGGGMAAASAPSGPAPPGIPTVGEAPSVNAIGRAQVEAIPRELGVLTPKGALVFDPQIEYAQSSANRLVFRGIELVPGIQIGLIEASDVSRNTVIGTAALRYGITDRLEIEGRLPYVYRDDHQKVAEQRNQTIVRTIDTKGSAIGDAEATMRFQLSKVRPLRPVWIASLRVKSATGIGPFEIPYDEFGVAAKEATGSGFWGVEPGISFLLPSDPVVIYGGASYLHQFAKDINRTIGNTPIGRVTPGSAIEANLGFGFAINPQFSFSLGYRYDYLFPTKSEIGDTIQKSDPLHVGRLLLGMSYRVTDKQVINVSFEFGVTKDAPNVDTVLRSPITVFN